MTESKPVELLRDRQGVYGIGISDAYDIEAWHGLAASIRQKRGEPHIWTI